MALREQDLQPDGRRVFTADDHAECWKLRAAGYTWATIGALTGWTRRQLYRKLGHEMRGTANWHAQRVDEALALHAKGFSDRKIAKYLGYASPHAVHVTIRRHEGVV